MVHRSPSRFERFKTQPNRHFKTNMVLCVLQYYQYPQTSIEPKFWSCMN